MADKTENIKTRLSFDGEAEYKAACKDIGNNLKNLNAETRRVTAEYKGNESSIEALKAKQGVLSEKYAEQAKKVEEARKALERCAQQTGDNSEATQKLQRDLNYAQAALYDTDAALQAVGNELSEGVQAQRQYEAACQGIDKNLSLLSAELQEVNAKYKNNADSVKAMAEKQEVLKRVYDEQAKKVAETERAYESMVRQYGETSSGAKELETQLHSERAALYDVENQLAETGQQAEKTGGKFSGLSGILGGMGGVMAKGVAVASLGYAVSQADEAKGALNDFCAATGTATGEAGQYKQVMENIYNANFGEGFEDIAAAMAEVRQQAGDLGAGELEKMTTNALALRDTFDFDVAESTRAATQLMQKFGLSSDEAYNLIAQGAQNGLNKNGDLLDVINEYSNQYSQAGLGAEDMFNSIANGAATGVWSIDKMGDAFKEFSIRMNDGTAKDFLVSLGLNADEVVGKFQKGGDSAKEAMSQVSSALKDCDDKSLQYKAGVGLMGTMWEDMGADACTALMGVEGEISKSVDAMGQINAVKYDTFGEAMQGAGRILQTSFIMPIGEQALPIFSQFANELAQGAAEADGDMGKLARSFGDALGNMISGLSEMLPQIADFAVELVSGLADGIVESAPAIVQTGVGMIAGLVDGVVEAIPTLTESATEIVTTLINGIAELMPSLAEGAAQIIAGLAKGLGEALPELIPSVTDAMLAIVDTLINNVPMLIDAALQLVMGLADGIMNAMPLLMDAAPRIIAAIVNGLITGLPKILGAAGKLAATIISKLMELPARIPQAIGAGVEKIAEWGAGMKEKGGEVIAEFVAKVIDIVKETPQKIWNAIVGAVTKVATWGGNMLDKAKEAMNTMLTGIVTIVKETPQKIWNSIVGAVNKIGEWGSDMLEKAKGAVSSVVSGVVDGFKGLPEKITEVGKNLVQGLWNGISNAKDWVIDKIKGFGDSILDGIKSFFGINSPSRLMRDEVGVYLAQGIGVGFSDEMANVNKQIEDAIPQEFDIGAKVNVDKGFTHGLDGDWNPKKPKPKGGGAAGIFTVIQNIYANTTDYAKQQKEAARQFRMIARTV